MHKTLLQSLILQNKNKHNKTAKKYTADIPSIWALLPTITTITLKQQDASVDGPQNRRQARPKPRHPAPECHIPWVLYCVFSPAEGLLDYRVVALFIQVDSGTQGLAQPLRKA